MIEVKRVGSSSDWDEFLDLPFRIYHQDPHWPRPPRAAVRRLLDVDANPFYRHGYSCALIAVRDGRTVGRVAAFADEVHNRVHRDGTGFFGLFECENDAEAARALFAQAERWLMERGLDRMRGPMTPVLQCQAGVRLPRQKGALGEATAFGPYQPGYYAALLEGAGFKRYRDLYSYEADSEQRIPERLLTHSDRLKKARGVSVRALDPSRWDEEIETLRAIYQAAWEDHWAFVPLGREEFAFLFDSIRPIFDPRLALIAEVRGKAAGFALALPEVSPILRRIDDPRFGLVAKLKFYWALKGPSRASLLRRCVVLALGVRREFARYGIGHLLYTEYLWRGPEAGYPAGVVPGIPEDDASMNRALHRLCGDPSEVHRLYEKPISG